MITVKSKKELVGKNILMNGDWFSPEHIVEYEIEKITDVVSDTIRTSQSAPYGSTNSTNINSLVNNSETLKKDLLKRFDNKKLSPDTIIKVEFFNNYKNFIRIDPVKLDPITTKNKDCTVIVSPSTRLDIKNQITIFKDNEPIGHINCKTNEEVKSWLSILQTEYQL